MARLLAPTALTLTLNMDNLQLSQFQHSSDNNRSVQRFIDEQHKYVRWYAKDGAMVSAEWINNQMSPFPSKNPTSLADRNHSTSGNATFGPSERVALLSSPILQPRVPNGPAPNLEKFMERTHNEESCRDTARALNHIAPASRKSRGYQRKDKDARINEYEARTYDICWG